MANADLDLLKGTLDVLVLKALSWGPNHGFGVGQWIRDATRDDLRVEDGALYTALHRLEERGMLAGEWGLSDNNRKAKFYTLTAPGRAELARSTTRWTTYATAVFRVLQTQREAITILQRAG
jgi:transcriptional regulator